MYNCASVTIRRVIARTERTQLCGQEQGCKERKKTGEKIKTKTRAPFLWEDTSVGKDEFQTRKDQEAQIWTKGPSIFQT